MDRALIPYFFLSWLDEGWVPVAEGDDVPARDVALSKPSEIRGWQAPRVTVESGDLVDYLPNNVGLRLCSPRMRRVIEEVAGPEASVQWLPAKVVDIFGNTHPYWVLHLRREKDVLNASKSLMVDDFVVKPVLDPAKVSGHHVVGLPGATLTLMVSDGVRHALTSAGCTGIAFEPVRLER